MTKRKPRARPATVERWLRKGIPGRTFDRLVQELAPSESTARRWAREEVIPERVLRGLKPPRRPAPPPARRPEPPPKRRKPRARPEPREPTARFPGWQAKRPPPEPEEVFEEEEEEERPPPRRRPETVLTREQIAGMVSLGLSPDQISAAGREETQEERDARVEREAIQAEAPAERKPVTPLELEQARELLRLRQELERAHRQIEGPPRPGVVHPLAAFRFDTEPKPGETDDHWFERISEEIIAEARLHREGESPDERADRLVTQIRKSLRDKGDAEAIMDNVATDIAMETGENVRDVYRTFFSPGWRGVAA